MFVQFCQPRHLNSYVHGFHVYKYERKRRQPPAFTSAKSGL
jgi:hypothetical protein